MKNKLYPKLSDFKIVGTDYSDTKKIIKFEEKVEYREADCFQIFIRPTEFCNYSCHYCFNYSKEKIELNLKDIDYIDNYLKTLNKDFIRVYIHGGEPLSYKYLPELIKMFSKYVDLIDIQTNFSLFKIENFKMFDYPQVKFSISVHEHVNIIKQKKELDFLFNKNMITRLDIMVSKENRKKSLRTYKILKNIYPITQTIGIIQDAQYLYKDIDPDSYNDRKFLIEYENGLIESISFYGMYKKGLIYNMENLWCEAGKIGFLINYDGNIYRCQADMNHKNKPIGNIRKSFPENKWTICGNKQCLADFEYRKYKDFNDTLKVEKKVCTTLIEGVKIE